MSYLFIVYLFLQFTGHRGFGVLRSRGVGWAASCGVFPRFAGNIGRTREIEAWMRRKLAAPGVVYAKSVNKGERVACFGFP